MSQNNKELCNKLLNTIVKLEHNDRLHIAKIVSEYEVSEKKQVLKEYSDGIRFKLKDLNEEIFNKILAYIGTVIQPS